MRYGTALLTFSLIAGSVVTAMAQNSGLPQALSVQAGTPMSETQHGKGHGGSCCKPPNDGVVKKNFPGTETVRMETPFVGGKENGTQRMYFEDGKLKQETQFVDGKITGSVKWYYPSGVVKEEAIYKEGEQQGPIKAFNEKGEPISE